MQRFKTIWGPKWTDKLECSGGIEAVSREWQGALDGLSGEQIKRALEHCRTNNAWPPEISEFLLAARGGDTAEQAALYGRIKSDNEAMLQLSAHTYAEEREVVARELKRLMESLREH